MAKKHCRVSSCSAKDWESPDLEDWLITLQGVVSAAEDQVILVAHSLGCLLIAHGAGRFDSSKVRGALLVAPPDVESMTAPADIVGFGPMPRMTLPFRSVVVASEDDEFVELHRANRLVKKSAICSWSGGRLRVES